MYRPLPALMCIMCASVIFSQALTVKVVDFDNLQPIQGIYIYNNEGGIDSTGPDGRVTLPVLTDDAALLFKHRLYKTKELTYGALMKNKTVKMVSSVESAEDSAFTMKNFAEKKENIAGRVSVIGRKKIDLYNPQTGADLLGLSDEVFIHKDQLGGGSPMIRGFTGNSLLIVVDGVRINNAISGKSSLHNVIALDPGAVESADVLLGPGSALYGSDAMGGVFNLHFKEPVLSENSSTAIGGSALGRYSLAAGEKNGRLSFNIGMKKFASLTSVSFSDFGDLRMGKGGEYYDFYSRKNYVQEHPAIENAKVMDMVVANTDPSVQDPSGYYKINALEKLRYAVNSKLALDGTLLFSTTGNVPRYSRLLETFGTWLKYSEWYYGPQRWLLGSLALNYTNPGPLFNQAKVALAYQNFKESCNVRRFRVNVLTDSTETVDMLSGTVDCSKPIGGHSVLAYGVETALSTVSSTAGNKDLITGQSGYAESRYPDGINDCATGAVYGYFRTNWNSTLSSVAGARYSRIYLHSLRHDTLFISPQKETRINTGVPSGNAGLILRLLDFWRISLNGSTGFHAPNLNDMSILFTSATGYVSVPNSDLRPERVYSVDFGNELTFGKYAGLEAALFTTRVDNLIVQSPYTYNGQDYFVHDNISYPVRSLINQGSATIEGGTLSLRINFSNAVSLKNTVTLTAGLDSDNNPLRSVPPLFGASHLLIRYSIVKGDFFVRFNGIKTEGIKGFDMVINDGNEPFLYPLNGEGLHLSPSWYTLNLVTTAILGKFFDLNLGVENILDKCYRPYASGIAAPGRTVVVSLRRTL